jgi:4-hydroxy-2-oxoglutarate aldolase
MEVYELARAGESARALALQQRLMPASKKIVSEGGVAGTKYAMDVRGYFGGLPRRPLLPLSEPQKKEITAVLTPLTEMAGMPARMARS